MRALPSACGYGPCKNITREEFCDEHWAMGVSARARRASPRAKTAARGYGGQHRKWARQVLKEHPLCVRCLERGITTPSVIADHIEPWQDGGEKFALENGQGLCRTCNNQKTAEDVARRKAPA